MDWFIHLLPLVAIFNVVRSDLGDACTTPTGRSGNCTLVRGCDYVLNIIRNDYRTKEELDYVESCKCGETADQPPKALVCCPLVSNVEGCGVARLNSRVFGGNETARGEHPWAGVIVFKKYKKSVIVECGCSLLNARWVLTAAHCLDRGRGIVVHSVRFNEWNARKKKNCTIIDEEEVCRQEYEVEAQFVHPGFQANSAGNNNDIGLLKTRVEVTFNDYVVPICLPLLQSIQELQMDQQPFIVTGYGETNDENRQGVQRHVFVHGTKHEDCDKVFTRYKIPALTENQICAGGKPGEDSCHGDSGGPLMLQEGLVHYLVGVVSFGSEVCGIKDRPAVYTNVIKYLGWIEETILQN